MPDGLLLFLGFLWVAGFLMYRRHRRRRSDALMVVPGATRSIRGGGGL